MNYNIFLGYPIADWLKVKEAAECRNITILELLAQFKRTNHIDYYAWKERHGAMALALELQEKE